MFKENSKFYLIVSVGFVLVVAIGYILFFEWDRQKQQAISNNFTGDENLFNSEDERLNNKAAIFFDLIGEAKNIRTDIPEQSLNNVNLENNEKLKEANPDQNNSAPPDFSLDRLASTSRISIFQKPIGTVFPADYLSFVGSAYDLMKQKGFVAKNSQLSLNQTADVFKTMEKFLEFSVQEGVVKKENYSNLRYGVTVIWPRVLEMENGNLQASKYLNKNLIQAEEKNIFEKTFLFMENFASEMNLTSRAVASCKQDQGGDCYRVGVSVPGSGFNGWTMCCDCEIQVAYACVPVGCKNSLCSGTQELIWDPMMGICGCGGI